MSTNTMFFLLVFMMAGVYGNDLNGDEHFLSFFCQHRATLSTKLDIEKNTCPQNQLKGGIIAGQPQEYFIKAVMNNGKTKCDTLNAREILIGMRYTLFEQPGHCIFDRFIKDTLLTIMVIKALAVSDKGASSTALEIITEKVYPPLLSAFSDSIKHYFSKSKSFNGTDSLNFLPLLKLDSMDINILRKRFPNVGFILNAQVGDTAAVCKLIEEFRKEENYGLKKLYAQKLGSIGTSACAVALISELSSNVFIEQGFPSSHFTNCKAEEKMYPVRQTSIRFDILKALGRIYYNNELFTSEVEMLKSGEYVYALIKSGKMPENPLAKKKTILFESIKLTDSDKMILSEYLKKVLSWAQKEYNLNVMIDSSECYIDRIVYRNKNN